MRSAEDLKFRIKLAGVIIDMLGEMDDERAPAAIERYKAQRAKLEQELQDLKPLPVVIGLQAASLSAVVPKE